MKKELLKVISSEETNISNKKKKLLLASSLLILCISLSSCSKNNNSELKYLNKFGQNIIEYNNYEIFFCRPEKRTLPDGRIIEVAPYGYIINNGVCYKVISNSKSNNVDLSLDYISLGDKAIIFEDNGDYTTEDGISYSLKDINEISIKR